MKTHLAGILLPAFLALFALTAVALWLQLGSSVTLSPRVPGLEGTGLLNLPDVDTPEVEPELVVGQPVVSDVQPSQIPGSWPCFRGINRDGIHPDAPQLSHQWPENGPPVVWQIDLGPGHAGPAVVDGRVYLLDYDTIAKADTMRCLSLDSGEEIWRNSYPVVVPYDHGMSRTVPAVADGCVVSLGPKCHVVCWDALTGEARWSIDLVRQFQTEVPKWYAGQCPLIERGRAILAPCGSAMIVAVDCQTGEIVWESPKLHDWKMTHVSILPMDFGGQRIYVYCGSRGAAAVSAEDGSLVWETSEWIGRMATCPTPVDIGDGRIFFSSGYRAGSLMVRLTNGSDGTVGVESLFRLRPAVFGSEQQTPLLYDGHLYGARTEPGGKQLACLDLEGQVVWNSGQDKFWRGPYLIADGVIFVLDDNGTLSLVEATHKSYRRLAQHEVFADGYEAWAPMALVAGRLLLRDLTRMVCLDVRRDAGGSP